MRRHRLHLDMPLTTGQELPLPAEAAHRLAAVLRLGAGAEIEVFDGRGGCRRARVLVAGRREVRIEVGALDERERESPLRLCLAQGISRGQKMDYTLQKAVELGVHALVPLITENCNVRLDAERAAARLRHWQNVIIGACEQCGRNRLPQLSAPVAYAEWIARAEPAATVLLDPEAEHGLAALAPPPAGLWLLAGPEGGFSPLERELARGRGCAAARLGPRVLRTETAAVAALAACQVLWGDLG